MSKYGVSSGPYFPAFGLSTERYGVFSPHAGKYRPEKTPYLNTFHAVLSRKNSEIISTMVKQLKLSVKESRNILTQQRELPKHAVSFIFCKIYLKKKLHLDRSFSQCWECANKTVIYRTFLFKDFADNLER